MDKKSFEMAIESLKTESRAVLNILDYIDEKTFSKAVDIMSVCGKIITCASGSSGIAAKKFAHTLCCIELNGYFLSPAEAVHGGLGCVKKNDAVVIVSRGGKTVELLPIVAAVKKKEAKIIAVTENLNSPIAKAADVVIPLKIEKESDKYNVMATSSFVATIAIFDAVIVALIEETGYRLEQFALIHPGGAVGEFLNK